MCSADQSEFHALKLIPYEIPICPLLLLSEYIHHQANSNDWEKPTWIELGWRKNSVWKCVKSHVILSPLAVTVLPAHPSSSLSLYTHCGSDSTQQEPECWSRAAWAHSTCIFPALQHIGGSVSTQFCWFRTCCFGVSTWERLSRPWRSKQQHQCYSKKALTFCCPHHWFVIGRKKKRVGDLWHDSTTVTQPAKERGKRKEYCRYLWCITYTYMTDKV